MSGAPKTVSDEELFQMQSEFEAGVADMLDAYDHASDVYYSSLSSSGEIVTIISASSTS